MLRWLLGGLVVREGTLQLIEHTERRQVFDQAREYADLTGKPLLVVGTPKSLPWGTNHSCGDVTIDIVPGLGQACPVEIADVRSIPYHTGYFGAAFVSHVIEHLPTVDDAVTALDELERVADRVFVVSPHKSSVMAWMHPSHHLWVTPSGDGYIIEQRGRHMPPESYVT